MRPRAATLIVLALLALAPSVRAVDAMATASGIAQPQPTSPIAGMTITDVATAFAWSAVDQAKAYDIQVAKDEAFHDLVIDKRTPSIGYHRACYRPKDLLPAGSFRWRVRAVVDGATGPWSTPLAVAVTDRQQPPAEPVRSISAAHPLFLMRSRVWDPLAHAEHVDEIIPRPVRGVIVVDDLAMASTRVLERAARYEELGLDFVIWNDRCQVPLPTIEYVFQHFPHCIGTAEGEHFSGMYWEKGPEGNLAELDFVHRAWRLCAAYGRFYFFADGDGGSYRWPEFAVREREELARYRRNVVLMFKTTLADVALHSYGAIEGLAASGTVENTGTWVDEWIWPCCGFGKLGEIIPPERIWEHRRSVGTRECPWIYDIQLWLMGIASGSTVFHLESAHQWSPTGAGQAHYQRVFLPFVRAVVEHGLIPRREAFLRSLKLAVTTDPALTAGKHQKRYTGALAFLGQLYALDAPGDQECLPNQSRYGVVCLLPPWVASAPGLSQVVPLRELGDPVAARARFDAAYPARFSGDAFMWECDGTVIVTSSAENRDVVQRFAMPLEHALMRGCSGAIGVHQYLVAKLGGDGRSCWLQANGEHPDRRLELDLACRVRPQAVIHPAGAGTARWDDASGTLHLQLAFGDGAVEVELAASGDAGR
jgi:hypothetical protein